MILEIDAGNTRIKWRLVDEARKVASGAILTKDSDRFATDTATIGTPHSIRLATVAGAEVTQMVSGLAQQWGAKLCVPVTTAQAAGVRCGYHEPATMGVDRWLASIAAFHHVGGACVVVDLGSAITVDVVDESGLHHGGYIVPGLRLMRESLRLGTHDVKVSASEMSAICLGRSTTDAVNHGALRMIKNLVESVAAEMLPSPAKIVLTGGDASWLQPVLADEVECIPDLVLDGLALVAE